MEQENKLGGTDGGKYSATGSSAHYKNDLIEFIDNIERLHGTPTAYLACESNILKYRGRAGKKAGVPLDKDMIKANWYEKCAEYLREKIEIQQTTKDWVKFDKKYGAGRHYINTPVQILNLIYQDFEISSQEFKGLGTIVDEKLK